MPERDASTSSEKHRDNDLANDVRARNYVHRRRMRREWLSVLREDRKRDRGREEREREREN